MKQPFCAPSALLATALLLAGAALFSVAAPARGPVVHVDERFNGGRNAHAWRFVRNGACGPGASPAPIAPPRYAPHAPRPGERAPAALFRSGAVELRAVSGPSGAPDADECGVHLYTTLGKEKGVVHNGGPPLGDWQADLRFRLKTGSSVFTFLFAFGDPDWRYVALMIPAGSIAAVPNVARGRVAVMRPGTDVEADNAPIAPGRSSLLSLRYVEAVNTLEARLDGRPLSFRGEHWHEVDDFHIPRPFGRGGAALALYSEAQLDAGADSRVELLSVRLVSERGPRASWRRRRRYGVADIVRRVPPFYSAEPWPSPA